MNDRWVRRLLAPVTGDTLEQRDERAGDMLWRASWLCTLTTLVITLFAGFVSWVDLRIVYLGAEPFNWGGPYSTWAGPLGVLMGWGFLNSYAVGLVLLHGERVRRCRSISRATATRGTRWQRASRSTTSATSSLQRHCSWRWRTASPRPSKSWRLVAR